MFLRSNLKNLFDFWSVAVVFFIERGKGDHCIYIRHLEGRKRVVPIDMGAGELSPAYVLRIFRQFGFTDKEIEDLIK